MRYCPVCDARYQDEVIKFCTKDGTPLVDDAAPNFTALPSDPIADVEDEIGEETIIRRRPAEPSVPVTQTERADSERIVIPTVPPPSEPRIRPRTQAYYPPPPEQNTVRIVVLTILGTLFVLACGAGLFWLLSSGKPANANVNINMNANQNVNLNTNLGFDSNFNFNAGNTANMPSLNTNLTLPTNLSTNSNLSLNANLRPSPTPRSSPTPSPRLSPTPYDVGNELKPTPAPTTTPRTGPRPPTNTGNANRPRNVNN